MRIIKFPPAPDSKNLYPATQGKYTAGVFWVDCFWDDPNLQATFPSG